MFAEIKLRHFPTLLTDKITVEAVSKDEITQVWRSLAPQIFSPLTDLGHYQRPQSRAKASNALVEIYSQRHREWFVFYDADGSAVGWSNGEMIDAETFFMSWSGLLPAYQGRGIYSAFLPRLMAYLSDIGYERVTSKHMITNRPVLVAKLKAGFHISGVELDERWGAQVALAYYFHDDRRQGFDQAFSLEPFGMLPTAS